MKVTNDDLLLFSPASLTSADAAGEHELGALVVRAQDVLDQDPALVVHQGSTRRNCNEEVHLREASIALAVLEPTG